VYAHPTDRVLCCVTLQRSGAAEVWRWAETRWIDVTWWAESIGQPENTPMSRLCHALTGRFQVRVQPRVFSTGPAVARRPSGVLLVILLSQDGCPRGCSSWWLKNRILTRTKSPKRVHISRYTKPYSTILQWFESPPSQLSHHCKLVEHESAYSKVWTHLMIWCK